MDFAEKEKRWCVVPVGSVVQIAKAEAARLPYSHSIVAGGLLLMS
jgi:hypothetical protein